MKPKTHKDFDTVHVLDARTGKPVAIKRWDINLHDWGYSFYVKSELDAYRLAHQTGINANLFKIVYITDTDTFLVSVINKQNDN